MKKLLYVLLTLTMVFAMAACKPPNNGDPPPPTSGAVLSWVTIGTVERAEPRPAAWKATLADVLDDNAYKDGLGNSLAEEIALASSQASAAITYGLASNSTGATVEFAQVAASEIADPDIEEIESRLSTTLTGRTFADGDYLVVKVTAQTGGAFRYYRFNITLGRNAFLASIAIGGPAAGGTPHNEKAYVGNPISKDDDFDDVKDENGDIAIFQTDFINEVSKLIALSQDEDATLSYVFKVETVEPTALPADGDFEEIDPQEDGVLLADVLTALSISKFEDTYLYIKIEPTSPLGTTLYYVMKLLTPKTNVIKYGVPELVDPLDPGAPFYIDPIWDTATALDDDGNVVNWPFVFSPNVAEGTSNPAHTTAKAKALWDDNGIWVLLDVDVRALGGQDRPLKASNDHEGDSLEVFINERLQILGSVKAANNTDNNTNLGNQFRTGINNYHSGETAAAIPDVTGNAAIVKDGKPTMAPFTDDGYAKTRAVIKNATGTNDAGTTGQWVGTLEEGTNGGYQIIMYAPFKLKTSANANAVFASQSETAEVKAGAQIGFEVQINTNRGTGRDGIMTWNGYQTQAYNNAAGYGLVILEAPSGARDTKVFPTITAQELSSASYAPDVDPGDIEDLEVTTTGTIQWFESDTEYGEGTPVAGETNATFTPVLPAEGTAVYYYAAVTQGGVTVVTNSRARIYTYGEGEGAAIPQDPYDLGAVDTVTLDNNAHAIYRFILPDGAKWGDYSTITVDYRADDTNFNKSLRSTRLYGAIPENLITLDSGGTYYRAGIENDYIFDDLGKGYTTNWVDDLGAVEEDKWFTVTFKLDGTSGTGGASAYRGNVPKASATYGPFYFGVGLTGGSTDGTGAITSDIRRVTLVHGTDPAKNVVSGGSGFDKPAFMSYDYVGKTALTSTTSYEDDHPTVRAVGNGTLFVPGASYAQAPSGQVFEYKGNEYWIVGDLRNTSGDNQWDKVVIAPFNDAEAAIKTAIAAAQGSYGGGLAGYTRIGYSFAGDILDEWDDYSKITLSVDVVPVAGRSADDARRIQFRTSADGSSSTDIAPAETNVLKPGFQTLTFTTAQLTNKAISAVKSNDGAFLFRVIKIELHD